MGWSASFCLTWRRLGVVGYIPVRVGSFRRVKGSSGSRVFTCALLNVAGLIQVGARSLECDNWESGSFWFKWVHLCTPQGF